MKAFSIIPFVFAIVSQLAFGGDLGSEWRDLMTKAAKESRVSIPSSHTGSFGGVFTTTYELTLDQAKKGDAALILYNACAKSFHTWAKKEGASHSSTNDSRGEVSLRIKATNGDYFSALYQPASESGGQGSLTIVVVDADEFAKEPPPKAKEKQSGAAQAATASKTKSGGQQKPKPELKKLPQ